MTVLGCARCRTFLTCRPPEARSRQYSFPYADDFAGCDICGALFCAACSGTLGHRCSECEGTLHPGERREPTGAYRLPPALRELPTAKARHARVREWYDEGRIVRAELEHYAVIIDEVDEAGTQAP